MQWGKQIKFLQEVAAQATTADEIPKALRSRPVLTQFQQAYWKMYQDLTGSRQYTQAGVAEIPYHLKVMWLDENGIEGPDERRDYMQVVSALDSEYLDYFYKNKG